MRKLILGKDLTSSACDWHQGDSKMSRFSGSKLGMLFLKKYSIEVYVILILIHVFSDYVFFLNEG